MSSMKWAAVAVVVTTFAGLAGCAVEAVDSEGIGGSGGEDAVGATDQNIIGGTQVFGREEIGQFYRAAGTGRTAGTCTATLITNRYAITAAHCMNDANYLDTAVAADDRFMIRRSNGTTYSVKPDAYYSFGSHFEEKIFNGLSSDVALIRLPNTFSEPNATPLQLSQQRSRGGSAWSSRFGYGCNVRDFASSGGTGGGTLRFRAFQGLVSNLICAGDSGGPTLHGKESYGSYIYGINSGISFDLSAGGTFDVVADAAYQKKYIEGMMIAWGSSSLIDVDRYGADYRNFSAATDTVCRTTCDGESACQAWTHYAGVCHLKNAVPGFSPLTGARSGIKQNRTTGWETNYDRPGSDYNIFSVSTDLACRDACAVDYRCQSFTVGPGAGGVKTCWLKDEQPNPGPLSGFKSGAKRGFSMNRGRTSATLFHHFTYSMPSPEICQSDCSARSNCAAWEYEAPEGMGVTGGAADCYLYSDEGLVAWKNRRISGLKGDEFR